MRDMASSKTQRRLHWIQHVPFEDLGTIGPWARRRGYKTTSTNALTETYPEVAAIDWLVVMGGPMSVNDETHHPWLRAEKGYIADAIEAGKRVLGVCLGAQLVADVLGGSVRPNAEREIGWFPVQLTLEGRESAVFGELPSEFVAGHWHGDTFELPPHVVSSAASTACANQAFEYDGRVWGLQFHLEWDAAALGRLVAECGHELQEGRFVQSAEELLGEPRRYADSERLLVGLLDAMDRGDPPGSRFVPASKRELLE